MSTDHATLKVEADSGGKPILTIKSESLRVLPDQNRLTDETAIPAPISRNSKFVGFERGRRRLQPFVGPKQF